MGMNQTPVSERVHIGFFGKRNAGKSSVMNAVTGQNLAVVSDVKGTTTDPVYKTMELLPLGLRTHRRSARHLRMTSRHLLKIRKQTIQKLRTKAMFFRWAML